VWDRAAPVRTVRVVIFVAGHLWAVPARGVAARVHC
jgi:hypothetical protein